MLSAAVVLVHGASLCEQPAHSPPWLPEGTKPPTTALLPPVLHEIIERLGLEGTLKIIPTSMCAMDRAATQQFRLPRAPTWPRTSPGMGHPHILCFGGAGRTATNPGSSESAGRDPLASSIF